MMDQLLWLTAWWYLCVMVGVPVYVIYRFCKMIYQDFIVSSEVNEEKKKDAVT